MAQVSLGPGAFGVDMGGQVPGMKVKAWGLVPNPPVALPPGGGGVIRGKTLPPGHGDKYIDSVEKKHDLLDEVHACARVHLESLLEVGLGEHKIVGIRPWSVVPCQL